MVAVVAGLQLLPSLEAAAVTMLQGTAPANASLRARPAKVLSERAVGIGDGLCHSPQVLRSFSPGL